MEFPRQKNTKINNAVPLDGILGVGKYLFNHWEEITARQNADVPESCTEGQVSHLLSERFSRDPMGRTVKIILKEYKA